MSNLDYSFQLNKFYQEILQGINKKDFRHYNIRTIRNFIIHFDKLKEEDKAEVYELINSYLNLIKGTNSIEIRENTVELYNDFVYPIARKYYSSLGFVPYARGVVFYYMLIILLVFLYFLEVPFVFHIIILIVFMIIHSRTLQKKINNKVFGLRY